MHNIVNYMWEFRESVSWICWLFSGRTCDDVNNTHHGYYSVSSKTIRLCKSTVSYFILHIVPHHSARSNYYVYCAQLSDPIQLKIYLHFIFIIDLTRLTRLYNEEILMQNLEYRFQFSLCRRHRAHARTATTSSTVMYFSSRFTLYYFSFFQFFTILAAATLECDMTHCVCALGLPLLCVCVCI